MLHEYRMPDAGEGLTEAEVLGWRVAVGDVVVVNQVLLEVETAKAAVELPSPYAGTVVELLAEPGEVVPVGQPIIRIDDGVAAAEAESATPSADSSTAAPAPGPLASPAPTSTPASAHVESTAAPANAPGATSLAKPAPPPGPPTERVNAAFGAAFGAHSTDGTEPLAAQDSPTPSPGISAETQDLRGEAEILRPGGDSAETGRQAVLVGYGVRTGPAPQRRARLTPHGARAPEPGPPGETARPVRYGGLEQARAVEGRLGEPQPAERATPVLAKPPVRRLAKDLGVDLTQVQPTGPGGTITHQDVTRAAEARAESDVMPLSHVSRMMSRAMTESAFTAPHVTEWVDVDVSAMTALIRAARERPDLAGLSITPLTFAALGLVRACRAHPTVNSRLDDSGENLIVHRSVHLGIAVDSPRGLVVPHIRDAHELGLRGMADALGVLIGTARAGRSRPEDLRGSTITLTNVGVFGVDGGTPILNPGEVAILALGRVLPRPWVVDGQVLARDVVTLALSFDHRVVDGALGSRVLREVADFLADPATALALD